MKDFLDRQPTQAGRRKITYDDGHSEFVTVEMADEPTVDGTPLNRKAFMELQGFQQENTVIEKESAGVTRITSTNGEGEVSVSVITKTPDGYVINETFTGNSGLPIEKTTTITKQGNSYIIGGELNE